MSALNSRRRILNWLKPFLITASCSVVFVALLWVSLSDRSLVYRENGVLETLSLGIWIASGAVALWLAAFRSRVAEDRYFAAWLAFLATAAALREIDAQIWLNPRVLGEYGVRYRIDWWLDGKVSILLKLAWGLGFCSVAFALVFPLIRLRESGLRLAKRGDRLLLTLALAFACLAMGFLMDDLLRGSRVGTAETRQLLEETFELIGAALFLETLIFHWLRPWSASLAGASVKSQNREGSWVPAEERANARTTRQS